MEWSEVVSRAPEKPGVYIFKGKKKPTYIGKAKNLRKRLQQHLKLADIDPKEFAILRDSLSLEWIVTRNEFEALVLEVDLIQSHKPRYNVLHKYGGGYPMLLLTDEPYPTVKVVRGTEHRGTLYGPFLQASKAYKVKKLIHKLFKLRTCDPLPERKEPCMDYHLGLCSAPCTKFVSKEEYQLSVEGTKALLSGEVAEVLPRLYEKIEEFSGEMLFEKCAHVRDQIKALENISRGQSVSGLPYSSADLFYRIGRRVGLFLIRGGKLISKEIYDLEREEELEEFLLGYYYSNFVPENILTNFFLSEEVRTWIEGRTKGRVEFSSSIPTELVSLAEENVKENISLEVLEEEFRQKLGIQLPKTIEGFDISHFYGEDIVGSCVVWEKGQMNKRRYRRYKVKSLSGIDDYGALREVLTRRAMRFKEKREPIPDLWLIDGGKGQLNVAVSVRDTFGLPFKVFSLAKEEEILFGDGGELVRLREEPLLYRVFGLIRDEAHRFALSYNRKLRTKRALEDVLSKVKGVGETRKKIIYRNFDNLYEFIRADEERLRKLGLPPSLQQEVKKYLE
ncbi:excinuclease ABC subunit UvrC [Hydrogenivirga sp. 128-5-R1-1]|uniref:excinuclease ABC subunit UvrC n=1 Tax=Hydrogenivirga sp. 128-5-R1-1 TaxID=392423 RepID=UPI00015F17AC|nr:excinuclease ABC subunit UvrC [Hydrogenivirga sp. 128-5-R1-1]EDP76224.1 repair excision nuclease subunit C [Hydrogenivirga sp. 128-5-R1-1]